MLACVFSQARVDSPFLSPRLPFIRCRQRHNPVLRKRAGRFVDLRHQQHQQAREMRIVAGYENVSPFETKSISHPAGRILRLKVSSRTELRKRVARTPEDLGSLLGTQLPAVPDHNWLRTTRGCRCGHALRIHTTYV